MQKVLLLFVILRMDVRAYMQGITVFFIFVSIVMMQLQNNVYQTKRL